MDNKHLIKTIKEDCIEYNNLSDGGFYNNLYLEEYSDSEQSGMYQLFLNGKSLWYGTLREINAIVKSMIILIDKAEEYDLA